MALFYDARLCKHVLPLDYEFHRKVQQEMTMTPLYIRQGNFLDAKPKRALQRISTDVTEYENNRTVPCPCGGSSIHPQPIMCCVYTSLIPSLHVDRVDECYSWRDLQRQWCGNHSSRHFGSRVITRRSRNIKVKALVGKVMSIGIDLLSYLDVHEQRALCSMFQNNCHEHTWMSLTSVNMKRVVHRRLEWDLMQFMIRHVEIVRHLYVMMSSTTSTMKSLMNVGSHVLSLPEDFDDSTSKSVEDLARHELAHHRYMRGYIKLSQMMFEPFENAVRKSQQMILII